MMVFVLGTEGDDLKKLLVWLAACERIDEVSVIKKRELFLERAENERPTLVFIRLGNTEIPGLAVGEMLHAIDENIRIVFFAEDKQYALNAYAIGAYGYLLCPIDKQKLDDILKKIKL